MSMEQWWTDSDREKAKQTGEKKPSSSGILFTKNPTYTGPGLTPSHGSDSPASNILWQARLYSQL